ncbi:MAG: bifunctional 2-C-methyl-D-erythritol 4-phosphate cytidylyltransferase/2-C-methyl-D-erythritol 2,4-cyclodiphosphate synthase [Rhodospirillaceae bacterium]|nr:bifunctional 2-C-methyl-D-erythritol 4-phosphate cytidylyltransferase/2-C-methyl-D-erythritol 2,4-cyclodiphosphate synthase [Rhodospirillaceae bacterium]
MTIAALIVAGGRGRRFGGELPKQYRMLAGKPVLRHAIDAFLSSPLVDRIQVVIRDSDRAHYDAATRGLALLVPVAGGDTRQASVRSGLEALATNPPASVLIHDAARPFLSTPMIAGCAAALNSAPGAIVAVPLRDTLKRGSQNNEIAGTVDRNSLWRAQTPQAFRFADILAAHRRAAGQDLTDDAAVAEASGLATLLVEGSDDNIKITTEDDLARAERLLAAAREYRTGFGYDVHRFAPGNAITLGGVRIPHDCGLDGHSDADVALHALTDAILGAIGAGDIGAHFPPSDMQWKGADSARFLAHAASLVRVRGGSIVHLDLTIVCERPKIGPHREAMVARIAAIAGLEPGRVSVKATTTEGLGFTGRSEGIAAQAVATVGLPR